MIEGLSIDNEYVKVFWVGLMDGDGSIQVNHWRRRSLQFRLVIKLKHNELNNLMLNKISEVIGGTVKKIYVKNNLEFVIWVVDDKKSVANIIKIYEKYPPLTTRKLSQLKFLKTCLDLDKCDITQYFLLRDSKYLEKIENIHRPDYFDIWLSGFIEAEGCFNLKNNHFFSIGHNYDFYLLQWIKEKFFVTNKIRLLKGKFFFLEVYKKEVLKKIVNHLLKNPLLGDKSESLKKFINKLDN